MFLKPMGKKSSGSWFTSLKKAFSPHKSTKTVTQHQDHDEDDDNKILQKKEKRRSWLFKKPSTLQQQPQDLPQPVNLTAQPKTTIKTATTARAAAEIRHLTATTSSIAAIIIQTTFRGYLARRALRALKGIVMLQAVIRGQNVRKQAAITLRCMQALLRVQSRVHDQRARLSHDESRKSMMRENGNTPFWESKHLQDIPRRKSMQSRDGTCIQDDLEELNAIMQNRKLCNRKLSTMDEKELEETANWLDQWIRAKQWENQRNSRASFDRRDSVKTIEIDSSRPSSRSGTCVYKLPYHGSHYTPNSPSRRSTYSPSTGQQPITPSPVRSTPLQIRSASPRCMKEERNANIRLTPRVTGSMCRYSSYGNDMSVPNYMAATESAKARIRSQSTPRQRPSTPDRERVGSVKKRLAYPVLDPCDNGCDSYYGYGHNLRSPSLKSVQVGRVGMDQQWFYADSMTGGEISPCSTTDLRRWLR